MYKFAFSALNLVDSTYSFHQKEEELGRHV